MMQPAASTGPVWPEGVSLLLGIGAQKAGTSWVYHYLQRHPSCRPGPIKELHYFDTVSGIGNVGNRVRNRLKRGYRRQADEAKVAGVKRLQAICEAPDSNHQSYVDLLTEGLSPGQVALDITPSYALVDAATLAQMAGLGYTRFLFLMREPVARQWSAIRMMVANRTQDQTIYESACQQWLDMVLAKEQPKELARADYAGALARLDEVVPAERRLVMFFETLFTQQAADRICDFLGIERRAIGDLGVVNEGLTARMRPDQEAALTERLRPQYQAVCATYGADVPEVWHKRFAALPERAEVARLPEGMLDAG